ncbi:class E sortase [Streptomyces sp. NBC_01725]|uniref:class E sortase n=1 Tax=Streptomyces sp. NBC_01725 TaxID=2975923 RepID=UPI002E297405|nr:class E sortase [Streptomyces sp. NBC_01725]
MTALRPEHDAGHGASYEQREPYEEPGAFEAAVDGLADPLNDPLPGQGAAPPPAHPSPAPPSPPPGSWGAGDGISAPPPAEREWSGYGPYPYADQAPAQYGQDWASQVPPESVRMAPHTRVPAPVPEPRSTPGPTAPAAPTPRTAPDPPYVPVRDDETVGLRTEDTHRPHASAGGAEDATALLPTVSESGAEGADTAARPAPPEPAVGGRAERRKAAKGGRGRGRRRSEDPGRPERAPGPSAPARPLSRVEARRAARALKDSPGVILSRAVGEIFISLGVLMLLFVTYQLWWTNIQADLYAGKETDKIQDGWAKGRQPGAFEPGQGFAIMHIPKLDVVVPIAEGIDKAKVLDRGMVGHYSEGRLKTAMPSDKQGNFAVAGHRNTHGEPFRYINRLKPGDKIVVETQDSYFTYDMASILPQTAPSNVGVIGPVPPGSGFAEPGRYITLTTCTPEFTSTYRMIVWGKMVEERPRGKGKPDALVG